MVKGTSKGRAKEKVWDYSGLEKGVRLQAESDGAYYAAEVITVSSARNRSKAPVKVHFVGYDDAYDVWLGGSQLRSKALKEKKDSSKSGAASKTAVKLKVPVTVWQNIGGN